MSEGDIIVVLAICAVVGVMVVLMAIEESGVLERRTVPPEGYIIETNGKFWRWRQKQQTEIVTQIGPRCGKEKLLRRGAIHGAWLDKEMRESKEAAQNWREA